MTNLQRNVSLLPFNTMHVEAYANAFADIHSVMDLQNLLKLSDIQAMNKLVLGGGSNILLTMPYEGIVFKNSIESFSVIKENDDEIFIDLGGGENWHDVVMRCVNKGYHGIENLALIPGTVGAAPIQNIGAYGVELKDVFHSLEAVNLETGEIEKFNHEECLFDYRDSIFKNELRGLYFISSVTLKLSKKSELNLSYNALSEYLHEKGIDKPNVKDVANAVIAIRNSKLPDPDELPNCGSFFKNPIITKGLFEELQSEYPNIPSYTVDEEFVKVPAGWLIEKAGWKGKRVDEVGTYKNQALVIVNYGERNGLKVLEFASMVMEAVLQKFNIDLEMEVNILGWE